MILGNTSENEPIFVKNGPQNLKGYHHIFFYDLILLGAMCSAV